MELQTCNTESIDFLWLTHISIKHFVKVPFLNSLENKISYRITTGLLQNFWVQGYIIYWIVISYRIGKTVYFSVTKLETKGGAEKSTHVYSTNNTRYLLRLQLYPSYMENLASIFVNSFINDAQVPDREEDE
jgi:hypothetical protein